MGFIIVGYYTRNTLYEASAKILIKSLERHNVPYYVEGIDNLGTWFKNTGYKPTFLLRMMEKFPNESIVYVDVDAEFLQYPKLFDNWSTLTHIDIGVYVFDRSCYTKSAGGFEVLSRTIFLKNNDKVKGILKQWEQEQVAHPNSWDHKTLEVTLKGKYTVLPGEYCKIFDRMHDITDPVIVHYQHSRKVKSKHREVPMQ